MANGRARAFLVGLAGLAGAAGAVALGLRQELQHLPDQVPVVLRLLEDAESLEVHCERPAEMLESPALVSTRFHRALGGWVFAPAEDQPVQVRPRKSAGVERVAQQTEGVDGFLRLQRGGLLARTVAVQPHQYLELKVRARVTSGPDPGGPQRVVTVVPLPEPLELGESEGTSLLELFRRGRPRPGAVLPQTEPVPVTGRFEEISLAFRTPFDARTLLLVFKDVQSSAAPVDLARVELRPCPLRRFLDLGLLPEGEERPPRAPDRPPAADGTPAQLRLSDHRLHPAENPLHPAVCRIDHLRERRTAVLLPPPAEAVFDVFLPPAEELVLEFGRVLWFERREDWRRRPVHLTVELREEGAEDWQPLLEERLRTTDPTGWLDRSADLSRFAGRRVSLKFRVASDRSNDVLLLGCPTVRRRARADPMPNIVLISIDTLRADALSAEGYPRPTTPNLDHLARHNAWFRSATSSSSYTLPAHGTMMTGQWPALHGAESDARGRNRLSRRRSDFLAARLREAGYQTAAFTGGIFLHPRYGFGQGFDLYNSVDCLLSDSDPRWDRHPVIGDRAFNLAHHREHDLDRVLDWVSRHRDGRFFLFLHTYLVHNYRPSPRFRERFQTSFESRLGADLKWIRDRRLEGIPIPPEDRDHYRDLYDATLAEVDESIGRLIGALRAHRLWYNTVFIVTSDHGEEFMDHGGMVHGRKLYQEMLRVPLLAHLPPGFPQAEILEPVSLADLVPTIFDLVGIEPEHVIHGRSLLPLIGEGPEVDPRTLLAELTHRGHDLQFSGRRGPLKLIEYRDQSDPERPAVRHELFDVVLDPRETRDLASSQAEARQSLQEAIEGQLDAARRLREQLRSEDEEEELSPEALASLAAIGYVEDEDSKGNSNGESGDPGSAEDDSREGGRDR